MKITVKNQYALLKLADWKKSYIADQLGITNTEVGQLLDGETIEIKKVNASNVCAAIAVLLREVKAAKPKGTEQ